MVVAKRLYAQEKREGRAADRTRADREETQVRSKEQRATLNRAGSMLRRSNEFEQRAALHCSFGGVTHKFQLVITCK
jgi:hypothetical protein